MNVQYEQFSNKNEPVLSCNTEQYFIFGAKNENNFLFISN